VSTFRTIAVYLVVISIGSSSSDELNALINAVLHTLSKYCSLVLE